MGQVLFTNNAEAILASSINAIETAISVQAGQGDLMFPPIVGGSGDWFPVTLRSATNLEICRCTARAGDVLTVSRAQEGTTAATFVAGSLCQLRLTAAALGDIVARIAAQEAAMALQGLQTGDTKYRTGSAAVIAGWVRANGLTIGNPASTATERANADTANLFAFLWTNFPDLQCPVSGGRGANPAADFAANKRITLPDAAGRAFISLDDAGAGAKSRLTTTAAPNGITPGATGGAETRTLVIANLPIHSHVLSSPTGGGLAGSGGDHNHNGTGAGTSHSHGASSGPGGNHYHDLTPAITDTHGGHTHTITDAAGRLYEMFPNGESGHDRNYVQQTSEGGGTGQILYGNTAGGHNHALQGTTNWSAQGDHAHTVSIVAEAAHTHPITMSGTHTHPVTLTGATNSIGSDTPFNNMPPFIALGCLYIKL